MNCPAFKWSPSAASSPGREVDPGLPDLGHRGRLVLPPLLLPVIPHLLSSEEVGHLVLAQVVIDIR